MLNMSAAIVHKNATTMSTIYFECGDIFNAKTSTENNLVNRTSNSMKPDLNICDIVDSKNSLELLKKNDHNNDNKDQQLRFHNALTRTISQPQPQSQLHLLQQQQAQQQPQEAAMTSLVTTLIENLGNMNLHRKLERTQSEPLPQQVNTSRYKTELCRPFEEAGECKYGEKCQFAHGYHELRNLQRHPKYKTEYCRTFHSVGFCPYGPRCHFVHNADEARAMQQQIEQRKLQNHSNFNNNNGTSNFIQQQQTKMANGSMSLPLSPPLSMSTGSDRESPTGSLSLSPTSSMTSFPFGDQISPSNSALQANFTYVNTPPDSPNAPMSPVNTPPPMMVISAMQNQKAAQVFIKPVTLPGKQLLQKSSSSPISIIKSNLNTTPTKVNSTSSLNSEEARLPVFNRLSATVETFINVAL